MRVTKFSSTTDAERERLKAKRLARLSGKKPKASSAEDDSNSEKNNGESNNKNADTSNPQENKSIKKSDGDKKKGGGTAKPLAVHETTKKNKKVTPITATFKSLGIVSPFFLKGASVLGYKAPTPIQQEAIPKIIAGHDLLAGAQTGTGKTAAFVLPILQMIADKHGSGSKKKAAHKAEEVDGADDECDNTTTTEEEGEEADATTQGSKKKSHARVLILTPTRELALQIESNIASLARFAPHSDYHLFATTAVFGGVDIVPQLKELKYTQPAIIVATPGRLLELAKTSVVHLSEVEFCVLDEADRMLDMGFYPDVSKILFRLEKNAHQTLLFSATFSPKVRKLAEKFLRPDATVELHATPLNSTVDTIQQCYYLVGREKKMAALAHIIKTNESWHQILVFVRTKGAANVVSAMLNREGVSAAPIHGDMTQQARTRALEEFKAANPSSSSSAPASRNPNKTKLRVLVATDIAARGLDIADLPYVINYEIPHIPKDYVHRVGRTGRAGKVGFAINLVCLDEEGFLKNIIDFAGEAEGEVEEKATSAANNKINKNGAKKSSNSAAASAQLKLKCEIPLKTDLPTEFGPSKGEKAQPIAMGTVTLWGGAGPAPSRSVLHAAALKKKAQIAAEVRDRKRREQGKGKGKGGEGRGASKKGARMAKSGSDAGGKKEGSFLRGRGGAGFRK